MRVVQLDTVEARFAGARGGVGERAAAGSAAARAMCGGSRSVMRSRAPHGQRLELARARAPAKLLVGRARRAALERTPSVARFRHAERAAMIRRDRQEALEELAADPGRRRTRQKIDELNEEPRLAGARAPHRLDQRGTAPATNRASPMRSSGPLATSRMPVASTTMAPGPPAREALVPGEHFGVTSPSSVARHGHHGGHPGALPELEAADAHGLKQPRLRGFPGARPSAPTAS